jgi:hypothetical protein
MHTEGIYKGLYKRRLENWLVYNFGKFEYPSKEILENAKTIIIPGSSSSAYDYS